jgi:3-hydroxyacyl-CoA dehydrogenase
MHIKKVAILGSGVMGSRIACHFANIGTQVLLLDMPTDGKKPNTVADTNLQAAIKSNPAPLYHTDFASRISTGNFADDMPKIADCDWIIEVVVERLDIKQQLYEQVEKYRKHGTLITSNTSGIPIAQMTVGRTADFKAHFCGTHFFNPPRYLRLLEIIPTPDTKPEIIDFLMDYGSKFLGKTTVLCKDTPAFIANRIGVFAMMQLLNNVEKMGLSLCEIDKLTGTAIGRPKSATFRTADVVGLDTLSKVATGVAQNCPNDESKHTFELPEFVQNMLTNQWLGDKTAQGFYKKTKNTAGKTEILQLDLKTLTYIPQTKPKFEALELAKKTDNLSEKIKILFNATDRAGEFYRQTFLPLFAYCANRIPEISDEIYKLDDALKAGFGYELGAFETWDLLGVHHCIDKIKSLNLALPAWIDDFLAQKNTHFYKIENGKKRCYSPITQKYEPIAGIDSFIILDNIRPHSVVWQNKGCSVHDIGDGILNIEFHTKMNSIGAEVLEGINKGIDLAEKNFAGVVIANDGANFSAGANIGMIFMMAVEQEYDELNFAIKHFQNTMMRLRYSSIPVVSAPKSLALGGACEGSMHADAIVAGAELYMGLVEAGVGVIPGGGGSKEMAMRAADAVETSDVEFNKLQTYFMNIATAKVATSAYEARAMGYLRPTDHIVTNPNLVLHQAKLKCMQLVQQGYTQPTPRHNVRVLGRAGMAQFLAGVNGMVMGNYISAHDAKIAQKLAYVMCGGDLSYPHLVSEQYLLDLEREAFLSLCGERKTLERIQSILTTGKPLRN